MALRGDLIVDGSITTRTIDAGAITAVKMSASSITAANGAIGALAVRSLNMQDSAVTVNAVGTFSGTLTGNNSAQPVAGVGLVIDTAGLADKTLTIKAEFTATYAATGTSLRTWEAGLIIEGQQVAAQGGLSDRMDTGVTLVGTYSFVADGGPMTFIATALWYATANCLIASRTISLMGVKR